MAAPREQRSLYGALLRFRGPERFRGTVRAEFQVSARCWDYDEKSQMRRPLWGLHLVEVFGPRAEALADELRRMNPDKEVLAMARCCVFVRGYLRTRPTYLFGEDGGPPQRSSQRETVLTALVARVYDRPDPVSAYYEARQRALEELEALPRFEDTDPIPDDEVPS